jgi:DNA-binding transcriptional regulator YhcF (GntR family)
VFTPVDRRSEVPLATQLAEQLRAAIAGGGLGPGDRLPSIRELATATQVNVNTVRAVYARLEDEGVARSEHGRGTFVADERDTRRELRRQIARLETEVARGPMRAEGAAKAQGGRLLSTAELRGVRDALRAQVRELDSERAELMRRLEEIERLEAAPAQSQTTDGPPRRTSPSLGNVRIRWVGG